MYKHAHAVCACIQTHMRHNSQEQDLFQIVCKFDLRFSLLQQHNVFMFYKHQSSNFHFTCTLQSMCNVLLKWAVVISHGSSGGLAALIVRDHGVYFTKHKTTRAEFVSRATEDQSSHATLWWGDGSRQHRHIAQGDTASSGFD